MPHKNWIIRASIHISCWSPVRTKSHKCVRVFFLLYLVMLSLCALSFTLSLYVVLLLVCNRCRWRHSFCCRRRYKNVGVLCTIVQTLRSVRQLIWFCYCFYSNKWEPRMDRVATAAAATVYANMYAFFVWVALFGFISICWLNSNSI